MRLIYFTIFSICFSLTLNAQKKKDVVSRFKNDITYLASDQLEGRLTGSSGEKRSSLYIADEFKKYNLTPIGDDNGSFFQEFEIIKIRISQCKEPLTWVERTMLIKQLKAENGNFYPLSQSSNKAELQKAPTHIAGFGIEAPELNHNDYSDTNNIRGKVFIIQIGSPDSGKVHGKFNAYESLNYKVDQAIKHGASGVVFIRTDTMYEIPSGKLQRNVTPRDIPVIFVNGNQSSLLNSKDISFKVDIAQLNSTAHNVVGFINNHKKNTIIIGAHQDHLGYNEYGGSRDTKGGQIHNGADDNASGVAMMLELMRKIKKTRKYRKNNYVFIAFSGEEQGLLGSNYFVKHPRVDLDKVLYMLNYDMVGRLDSTKKTLMIYGVGTTPAWKKSISSLKTDTSIIKIKTTEGGTGSSDHTSFYYSNIPVLHFFTGQHYDYHMPSDDEHLINYDGMYNVYKVSMKVIKSVNKKKEMPFTATKTEESTKMSFKVTLGIMPDYIYDGIGLRVDGVNADRPGDKAGLLKGDVITKMGSFTIVSIQDYMKALGEFNKGDSTTIEVKRGEELKILNVTF
ncbi:MAG: M20/M25/M40 family metallo-hydrolase [Bacteroidia bacterium]